MIAQAVEIRDRSHASCVADGGFCPGWILDNLDRYWEPLKQHVVLTVVAVAIGFAIASALALLAHRHRRLVGPIVNVTGILYTIPSVAAFFLLLPITGRGQDTALIALVAYTLLILFRNMIDGLDSVPSESVDAGLGMGLTRRQLLWRVEIPLALPAIIAGIRIATVTTISIATVAALVLPKGLGAPIFFALREYFKTEIIAAGGLAVALAIAADALLVLTQRAITPWARRVAR